jgi:D-alanyl-D-alanine carboxypeptidase
VARDAPIVEETSGRSLAAELGRRIIGPLGLRGTSLPSSPRIPGAYAHGYSTKLGAKTPQDVTGISPTVTWAAGGLVSTADDLAIFYRALLGGRLLRADLLRAMETRLRISPLDEYGLGLWRTRGLALLSPAQRLRCSAFWGHNGDWPGYHADAFVTKDLTRQVVLLVNGDVEGHPGPSFAPLAQLAYCG